MPFLHESVGPYVAGKLSWCKHHHSTGCILGGGIPSVHIPFSPTSSVWEQRACSSQREIWYMSESSYFSYIYGVPVNRACLLMDSPENWSCVPVRAWSIIPHQGSPGPDTVSVNFPIHHCEQKSHVLAMRGKDQ